MRPTTLKIVLVLTWCLVTRTVYSQASHGRESLALVGAKIYPSPSATPIEAGTVLVQKGKIIAVGSRDKIVVPKSFRIVNCSGMVLTSAFWNCHVHFIEPKWQDADLMTAAQFNRQMTQMITSHGFAHVFDLAQFSIGNVLRIRNRTKKGDLDGPVIYTTGVPLTPPNGSPFYIEPLKLPEATDAQQAAAHVRQQIDSGADAIKLWTGSPVGDKTVYMPEDIVRQMTQTAHSLNKPVFAHPTDMKGVMLALDGGVDILAHTAPQDGISWSADTIRQMLAAHLALIPTLKLWKFELQKAGVADWAHNAFMLTAQQQLHAFSQAGGTVLFGTDVGYVTDYSTGDEYTLLAGAGLDFRSILAALTTTPAQRFGLGSRTGRIAAGMDADIVLLGGDPATDIRAFDKVVYTFFQGKILYKNIPPENPSR